MNADFNPMKIQTYFNFTPTQTQQQAFEYFKDFALDKEDAQIMIISGAAGTGKSSLMKAFIDYLEDYDTHYFLAAPTGRAARILGFHTGKEAGTIHNLIYKVEEDEDEDGLTAKIRFVRRSSDEQEDPAVFIIDEASMISNELDSSNFMQSEKPLLQDLLEHIFYIHPGNKVVFVGDRFQLPPVGSDHSPALDEVKVRAISGMDTVYFELTEVKRQEASSIVLKNAQKLREALENNSYAQKLSYPIFANAEEATDYFVQAFNTDPQSIGFIGWRNDDVYLMNQAIRQKLWGNKPQILQAGDIVMVNRTYTDEEDTLLPNGEFGVIQQISKFEQIAGLQFAQATISFENHHGYKFNHSCKLLLDTLTNASAFVDYEKSKALYGERIRRNKLFRRTKDKRFDRYLNALQLRYGFVVTCHKAQGGEWDEVIIHPRVPPKSSSDHARWLYTAITRARTQFYSFKPSRQ